VFQTKLRLALAAVIALAALATGCGGGGGKGSGSGTATDAESTSPPPQSSAKTAFIEEADKICSKGNAKVSEEISEYVEETGISVTEAGPSEAQEAKIFHLVVLPNIGRQGEEIAALTPPKGDEATIEDLTDTLAKEVAEAKKAKGAAGTALRGATEKAQAYGLKTCGI
jgi:hypothetical protein